MSVATRGTPITGQQVPGRSRAAKSAQAASQAGGAPGDPLIVEAKLARPALRRGMLGRERLVASLRRRHDERIVTLIAPPGYGKSTTLALWAAREQRPVAWVTLDAGDADPMRLLAHVGVAIDRAVGLDRTSLVALHGPRASVLGTAIPRITSHLHRLGVPFTLVLDDVHEIAATPSVDAVAMLVDYLPAHVTVALAGRTEAGIPLARLRSRGAVLDLPARVLALDEGETREMLTRGGRRASPKEVAELQERTEGWPVAVYLAARHPAEGEGAEGALPPRTREAGTAPADPTLAAYLDAELLGELTPAGRRLLAETSILEDLTGPLCDAVTGRSGSARILQHLETTNLLVTPIGVPGWYRLHPLLREHLRSRLAEMPVDVRELHRRSAAWLAAEGLVELAIEHSLAAGDTDAAAATLTAVALTMYREGRSATLARWLRQIGDPSLRRHPHLASVGAWSHLLAGQPAEAEAMLAIADAASYAGERPPGAELFETMRAGARAMLARHGFADAIADAEWAATHEPPGSTWRPASLAVLGAIQFIAGDRARAEAVLAECVEAARGTIAQGAYVAALTWQAVLAIEAEDWGAAAHHVAELDATAAFDGIVPNVTNAAAGPVAARVALHRGDAGEAARRMAGFPATRPALSVATPWLSVRTLLEAARAYLALGDAAGARTALLHADDIIVRRRDLGPLPEQVRELRARLRGLPPGPGGASTLTPAELRVLRLLPTYLTVPEIAERFGVATNTVKTQVQSIYGKLDATTRGEAVQRAVEVGLLEPLPILAPEAITRS